jgi:hypothetical protein
VSPVTPADRALGLLVDAMVDDLRMSRKAAERFAREHLQTVLDAASMPTPVPVDPDAPCEHLEFHVDAAVQRVGMNDPGQHGRVRAFMAEVHINCGQCGEAFRFMGVPAGMSYAAPAVSVDETEIRLPMRPASADPDFGLGIPGYAIRMNDPGTPS